MNSSGIETTLAGGVRGTGSAARGVGVVSGDGLHWDIVGFIPPDSGVPACHVPQLLVTKQDGREWLYVFYATQKGLRFTLNPGEDYDYRYDAIRAMRRRLD